MLSNELEPLQIGHRLLLNVTFVYIMSPSVSLDDITLSDCYVYCELAC